MSSATSTRWSVDRQEEGEAHTEKVAHLARRYGRIRQEIAWHQAMDTALADAPDGRYP